MRTIGWGVIGCGWVSQFHLAGMRRAEGARLVAVCDADEEAAGKAARESGAEHCVTDYHEVLALSDVDAVDVVLPTHLHCRVACEAAKAGKHVVCEKPLAPSVAACREMMGAAKANGVQLAPMHNRVFYGPHLAAKQIIAEGAIGEPVLFQANFLTDIGIREDGFLAGNWRGDRRLSGGGVVMESGVHLVYTAENLLGRIEEVLATTIPCEGTGVDMEEGALINGRFAGGGHLSLAQHRRSSVVDDRQLIVGTEGAIQISGVEAVDIPPQPVLSVYCRREKTWRYPEVERDWEGSFGKLIASFNACVLVGGKAEVTGEDGASAIAVVEAAYASAREGRAVSVGR